MSTFMQINYSLFQDINTYAGSIPWLDPVMIFCANTLIFFWPLFLLVVWGIPLNWRRRPVQPGEEAMLQERRAAVLWVAVACLVAYAINLLIEQFIFEPRPFVSHKVHILIDHAADSSFPSDHTAWSFAVIGMLLFAFVPLWLAKRGQTVQQSSQSMFLRKPLVLLIVAFVIGCSIGLARIYVGVHYPDDILGGAVDGLLGAYLVTLIRRWLWRPTNAVLRFAHTVHVA